MKILKDLKIAAQLTGCFLIVLCLIYPLVVFLFGQVFFPYHADGSLVLDSKKKVIGSELIAQDFQSARYFHPRPSAAGSNGYDAVNSSGSNLSPTSRKLVSNIEQYVNSYRKENRISQKQLIPVDAVTASASGLDPHISPQNAMMQIARVAKARGLSEKTLYNFVKKNIEKRTFGFLGQERVNVLLINKKLDELKVNTPENQ
jgi:K+-transporting ATPase ATPase C chain